MTRELMTEIIETARECGIKRLILFGSRARGDNLPRSDIDLAVEGGNADLFRYRLDETVRTLLKFDVVDLSTLADGAFLESIRREGVTIYEKTGELYEQSRNIEERRSMLRAER